MPLEKAQNIEELYVTLDNRVLAVGGRSVACFDPETGGRLWQVGLGGQLRRSAVAMDVDALYLSDDGHRVTKIGLEDGVQLWESESLSGGGGDDLTVTLQDGFVLVSSENAVGGLDAVTGLTLWRGTTPEKQRFVSRLVTRAYVAAIDVSGRHREGGAAAYFYDHRNASGVIPENGGVLPLGNLTDFRTALVVDGALVIQDGTTIHVYANK
jgi:outer membrane protein assembly factor BamB